MSIRAVVESTDPALQQMAIVNVAEVALPLLVQGHFISVPDLHDFEKELSFDRGICWTSTLALYFFAKYGDEVLRVIRGLQEDVDEAVSYDARCTTLRLASRELALMQQLVQTLRGPSSTVFASVRGASPLPREEMMFIQQVKPCSLVHIRRLQL